MILTTTLSAAAAAALINVWLMTRCGMLRVSAKVLHGDGGNPALLKRMRAHANFIESAPMVLILTAAIELAGKGGIWLPVVVGLYMLLRISHAFGMELDTGNPWRAAGAIGTTLTLLGLGVVSVLIALGKF